jgi:hypothetical protein
MHGYVAMFGMAFAPEDVDILTDAFNDAWARLQSSGAPYAEPDFADAARSHLARHIISAGRRGNLDRRKLADDALLYLARQKLSRQPPDISLL